MMEKMRTKQKKLQINLHRCDETEGYCKLLALLNSPQCEGVKSISVIHGYRGGQVLKKMVANFTHPKIEYIQPVFGNEGQTIIYLK